MKLRQNHEINKDRQEWNKLFNEKTQKELQNESERVRYYQNVNSKMNSRI